MSPVGNTLTPALSQRERGSYRDVVLESRLRQALVRLNPELPHEALEDAFPKLVRATQSVLEQAEVLSLWQERSGCAWFSRRAATRSGWWH
ncbi:MAG TPA: hypothetical protein VLT62_30210 [Candidatus Methylomirabilis sp.]|nr:hypothetical protein [Candidatus Methylomirabilis sp.]